MNSSIRSLSSILQHFFFFSRVFRPFLSSVFRQALFSRSIKRASRLSETLKNRPQGGYTRMFYLFSNLSILSSNSSISLKHLSINFKYVLCLSSNLSIYSIISFISSPLVIIYHFPPAGGYLCLTAPKPIRYEISLFTVSCLHIQ